MNYLISTLINTLSEVEKTAEATTPLTVTEALQSVFYRRGRGAEAEAARAVYCGINDAAARITHDAAKLAEYAYYTWTGGIPGTLGRYWVPCPYAAPACRQPHVDLVTHGGLTDEDVALFPAAFGERDDVPVAVQAARIDEIARETGLQPSLVVVSGDVRPESIAAAGVRPEAVRPGKSLHGYWALKGGTTRKMWTRIQITLVVVLRGDPSITNPGRLMRLPGVTARHDGAVRIQTVLLAEEVAYTAEEMLSRLEGLCAAEGVENIDVAYAALVFAATTAKMAKNPRLPLSEADRTELRAISATVIEARAMTQEQRERVATLTGRRTGTGTTSRSGLPTDRIELPSTTMITLRNGRTVSIIDPSIPERGEVCYDPQLEDPRASRSPSARIWPGGKIFSSAGGGRTLYVVAGAQDNDLPGVEMICSRPQAPTLEDLVDTILGAAGGAHREALLARRAEIVDEHVREVAALAQVRANMVDYWSPVEERVAARKVAAEALDFNVLAYAKRAMKLADEWRPLFRQHLASQGVVRPTEPCGFSQGLGDVVTDRMAITHRGCSKLVCYLCGPGLLATKAAAVCLAPVVGEDGKMIGAPMEERPVVYRYECAQADLATWRKRYLRGANVPVGSLPPDRDPTVSALTGMDPSVLTRSDPSASALIGCAVGPCS